MSLSEGQVLNNRYRVTSLVGQSEFGAFYLVWDQNSNIPCLVEEIADASEAAAPDLLSAGHANLSAAAS